MKVLVLGNLGSIGSRYCAILDYLGVEYLGVDKKAWHLEQGFTHCIIATPTDTHVDRILAFDHIPNILCEKPIEKEPAILKQLFKLDTDIRMVCNWKYALNAEVGQYDISYSNYNTGKDGLGWDCIQLIYLANKIELSTKTPYFWCEYGDKAVTLHEIEDSYVTMIRNWLELDGVKNDLWDLQDALKATEKTLKWIEENE